MRSSLALVLAAGCGSVSGVELDAAPPIDAPSVDAYVCMPSVMVGAGTPADPYQVCAAEQLATIGDDLAKLGAAYRVVTDFDLAGLTQTIGPTTGSSFVGTFDGGGHTLSNLTLSAADTGLFRTIGVGGIVRDFTLANVTITDSAAALVLVNAGLIEDVHVAGTVTGTARVLSMVAGISSGVIRGTSAAGTFTTTLSHTGPIAGTLNGTVDGCWSTAVVTGNNRVGGLVGTMTGGSVVKSFATGNVTGNLYVGGLAGTLRGASSITDSYANPVSVRANSSTAGGLVGNVEDVNNTITRSYGAAQASAQDVVTGGLVGAVAASAVVVATAAYWDTSLTTASAAGTGLTHAQMQAQASFAGWDFAAVWKFDNTISLFPILAYQ